MSERINTIASNKASANAAFDPQRVGNVYAGNSGVNSHKVNSLHDNGSGGNFVGGQTMNSQYVDMNTHDTKGDLGNKSDLVGHEFGHLFGLDDLGIGPYYHDGGIMEYSTSSDLKPISDQDVMDVLDVAENVLDGKTTTGDPKVTVIENIGSSDGCNPVGVTNQ